MVAVLGSGRELCSDIGGAARNTGVGDKLESGEDDFVSLDVGEATLEPVLAIVF